MKIIKKIIDNWNKQKGFNEWDEDFFSFLRSVYILKKSDSSQIIKKTGLPNERFEEFAAFARDKDYVKFNTLSYMIRPTGIDYLMNLRKLKQKEKHDKAIMLATIVIAFSALVQIVSIFSKEPETRNVILQAIGEIASMLILILFSAGIIGGALFFLIQFVNFIKGWRHRK